MVHVGWERERIHGHFTVHKLEQFNLKTTCRRLEDSVTALVGECLSFLSELTLYFTFQLLGFVYCWCSFLIGEGQEGFRHECKDPPKILCRQYFATSPTVTHWAAGNLPQKEVWSWPGWWEEALLWDVEGEGCFHLPLGAACLILSAGLWIPCLAGILHRQVISPEVAITLIRAFQKCQVLIIIKKFQVSKREQESVKRQMHISFNGCQASVSWGCLPYVFEEAVSASTCGLLKAGACHSP